MYAVWTWCLKRSMAAGGGEGSPRWDAEGWVGTAGGGEGAL